MNEPSLGQAIQEAASNPKIAAFVAMSSASIGAASTYELIQGALSMASMFLGATTAAVVLAVQLIKLARTWRAWRDDKPLPKDE